jgi:hypothetical protein
LVRGAEKGICKNIFLLVEFQVKKYFHQCELLLPVLIFSAETAFGEPVLL